MLELIKKAITSKRFYSTEYKAIKRSTVITYLLFLAVLYALLAAPVDTYLNVKQFSFFKEQVAKIPPALEITYNSENGLKTNVNNPYVLETSEDTVLVIDPNSKYEKHRNNKSEVVFRNRGFIIYQNGRIIDQNSYRDLPFMEFKITGSELKEQINGVATEYLTIVSFFFNFLINFLGVIFNVLWVSLIFAALAYVLHKVLKKNTTFLLQLKKIIFLSVFIVVGMAINTLTLGAVPFADIVLFGLGYLMLNRL